MRERKLVEPKRPASVSRALNAAWIRPFLFLIFIVVAWDVAIRLFRIPAYQVPAPGDVVAVLWTDESSDPVATAAIALGFYDSRPRLPERDVLSVIAHHLNDARSADSKIVSKS